MPSAARYAAQKLAAAARGTTPYEERIRRRMEAGESREEASGHGGRLDERIARNPDRYSDAQLRRSAERAADRHFGDNPEYDRRMTRLRVAASDRDTLIRMVTISAEEWLDLASNQIRDARTGRLRSNPFFYHGPASSAWQRTAA